MSVFGALGKNRQGSRVGIGISSNSQPNGQLSIALEFDSMPSSEFSSYTFEDLARIVIDFSNTENQLPQRRYASPSGDASSVGNASSAVVLSASDRSRMIVNLAQLGEFDVGIDGSRFVLDINKKVDTLIFITPRTLSEVLVD